MDNDDVVGGKVDAFVGGGDQRIIPPGYAAQKNSGQGVGREVQSGVYAGNVVGGNGGAEDRGEMQDRGAMFVLVGLELVVVHGAVGSTEIHGAVGDLLDARAGAYGLVVNLGGGVGFVILVEPFRINWV